MTNILTVQERRVYGSLAVCCVPNATGTMGTRPLTWYNTLCRLGITVPFFVVHDLGAILLGTQPPFAPRPNLFTDASFGFTNADRVALIQQYANVLAEVAETDVAAISAKANVEDAVIATVLARALTP